MGLSSGKLGGLLTLSATNEDCPSPRADMYTDSTRGEWPKVLPAAPSCAKGEAMPHFAWQAGGLQSTLSAAALIAQVPKWPCWLGIWIWN